MSNAALAGCGKCLACRMGYAPILCERPTEKIEKPKPRDVAKRAWYHGDICLCYMPRRKSLGWQVHDRGGLDTEWGYFDDAWKRVEELVAAL